MFVCLEKVSTKENSSAGSIEDLLKEFDKPKPISTIGINSPKLQQNMTFRHAPNAPHALQVCKTRYSTHLLHLLKLVKK